MVIFAMTLAAAVEGWRLYHVKRDARIARQLNCAHVWQWFSMYNEKKFWNRKCVKCEKQEPCRHDGDDGPR